MARKASKYKPPVWKEIKCRVGDLIAWEQNPVQLSRHDAGEIRKSLEKFGFVIPLVANAPLEHNKRRLIDGHQRTTIMQWADMAGPDTLVDVRVPDRLLSEKEATELTIRLRKNTGDFDFDKLANNFDVTDLMDWGFEEHELGIARQDKTDGFDIDLPEMELGGSASPFQLKNNVVFPSTLKYGMPALKPDMLGDVPKGILTWGGKFISAEAENYMVVYHNVSTAGLDFSKCVLSFYTRDYKFEQVFVDIATEAERFLQQRWLSIVAPNFSLMPQDPLIVQMYQVYKSRFCGRYFQEIGFRVIPDVDWVDEASFDFNLIGIPEKAPCIAVQLQTHLKDLNEKTNQETGLELIRDRVKPQKMVIYGCNPEKQLRVAQIVKCKTVFLESISQMSSRARVKRRRDQLAEAFD